MSNEPNHIVYVSGADIRMDNITREEERARMNATRTRIAASVATYVYPDSDDDDEEGGTRPMAVTREMTELE